MNMYEMYPSILRNQTMRSLYNENTKKKHQMESTQKNQWVTEMIWYHDACNDANKTGEIYQNLDGIQG